MRKSAALLLLVTLSLAFAPAPLPRPAPPKKDDLKLLQGTWDVLSCSYEGRPVAGFAVKMVLEGNQMTFFHPDGRIASRWSFTLNEKASPKTWDAERLDARAQVVVV